MVFQEFVENTICQMAPSSFELTKEILLGEKLIEFSVIKPNKAGIDALAEKVCDYFETFEIKANRTFGKQLEAYMNELDAIVAPRIGRAAQPKKAITRLRSHRELGNITKSISRTRHTKKSPLRSYWTLPES